MRHWQVTFRDACAFVGTEHRHHPEPQGAKWSVGAFVDGRLVGVVMVGRTVARKLEHPQRAEVVRLATDGHPNACSFLYGVAARAARAMGYLSLKTYTLASEPGDSLRAVGAKDEGLTDGGSWSRSTRPRSDKHPTEPKRRWELLHESAHLLKGAA